MGVSAKRAWQRRRFNRRLAVVETLCERVATGQCVAEVCRDPMFPPRATVMTWCADEPALAQMLAQARAACPEARRPCHRYSDALAEEVLARVAAGRGLAEVCAEGDMPATATAYRWLDERPAFAARYVLAKSVQAERLFDLAWRLACDTERDAEAVARTRLQINTLKWRVAQLAPQRYGPRKAMEAPAEDEGADGPETADKSRQIIEIRRFAVTPANRVVETTELVRGLTELEIWRLRQAIKAGRYTEAADGQLAEVAWRDFDCGDPPAWMAQRHGRD